MKSEEAFKTISEVATEIEIPQHVLRFWETRFKQIKPLKRGGNRRYYRPVDVILLGKIKFLLYAQGYTIRGVQKIFKEKGKQFVIEMPTQQDSNQTVTATIKDSSENIETAHALPPNTSPHPALHLDEFIENKEVLENDNEHSPATVKDLIQPTQTIKDILTELLDCKRLLDQTN